LRRKKNLGHAIVEKPSYSEKEDGGKDSGTRKPNPLVNLVPHRERAKTTATKKEKEEQEGEGWIAKDFCWKKRRVKRGRRKVVRH